MPFPTFFNASLLEYELHEDKNLICFVQYCTPSTKNSVLRSVMRISLLNKSIYYFKDLFQGQLCDEACPAPPSILSRVIALLHDSKTHQIYHYFSSNIILHTLIYMSFLLLELLDGRSTFILPNAHHRSQFIVGIQKLFYE